MTIKEALHKVFCEHSMESVIYFVSLKTVGESASKPLEYYHNNITRTRMLCADTWNFIEKKP